ncbi:L-2-amino-thiazoline-4-carboxylic acid hydrolase [candidate division KSB1 bacterium]
MKKSDLLKLSRRDLLTKVMPACALTCLSAKSAFASLLPNNNSIFQQAKHKFDKEYKFPRPVTYRQFYGQFSRPMIEYGKTLIEELGEEKALEVIKKNTYKQLFARGQNQAKRAPDKGFRSYVDMFKAPVWNDTLTMEIVEDTDTAFELKVTECISAEICKAADFAGKPGFATVCYGDYAWAEGFNPKIKLVRDKTLMEGHKYCNHRYIWTG